MWLCRQCAEKDERYVKKEKIHEQAKREKGCDFLLELEQLRDSLKSYTDKIKELGVSL